MKIVSMKNLLLVLLMTVGLTAHGSDKPIAWYEDFDKAMAEAKTTDKLLFLDFYAEWCGPCKQMDRQTYPNLAVKKQMQPYIAVRIDVDRHEQLAQKYKGNARKYGGNGIPAMIVVNTEGTELYRHHGFLSAPQLTTALSKVTSKRNSK